MDLWYTHARTNVWILSRYFNGQGYPYDRRGWPTWERTVAEILSYQETVLDLGMLTHVGKHSLPQCGVTKDVSDHSSVNVVPRRRIKVPVPQDSPLHYYEIVRACECGRGSPLIPEEFDILIDKEEFTCGELDRQLIKSNYARNFKEVMRCAKEFFFGVLEWGDHECITFCKVLPYCENLQYLSFFESNVGDAGVVAIAEAVKQVSSLQELDLENCMAITEASWWALNELEEALPNLRIHD